MEYDVGIWKELDRAVPVSVVSAPGAFLHEKEANERPACIPGVHLGMERMRKTKLLSVFRNLHGYQSGSGLSSGVWEGGVAPSVRHRTMRTF